MGFLGKNLVQERPVRPSTRVAHVRCPFRSKVSLTESGNALTGRDRVLLVAAWFTTGAAEPMVANLSRPGSMGKGPLGTDRQYVLEEPDQAIKRGGQLAVLSATGWTTDCEVFVVGGM